MYGTALAMLVGCSGCYWGRVLTGPGRGVQLEAEASLATTLEASSGSRERTDPEPAVGVRLWAQPVTEDATLPGDCQHLRSRHHVMHASSVPPGCRRPTFIVSRRRVSFCPPNGGSTSSNETGQCVNTHRLWTADQQCVDRPAINVDN